MDKILLAGATGYLGNYISQELKQQNYYTKVLIRNPKKFEQYGTQVEEIIQAEITDESKLRTSMCITVLPDTEVDGEIGKMTVEGGKHAIGHFELDVDEYEQAWKTMYGDWLSQSGYQPDDKPPFEIYHNDPNQHPKKKHIVDICIPVKPL